MPRLTRPAGWLALLAATPAAAHGDSAGPAAWTWDPWVTLPLGLILLVFAIGWLRLRARSAEGHSARSRSSVLFVSGWLVLAAALVSPLHQAGERSFALHMVEHELIMLVATPLLAASAAGGIILWGFPQPLRRAWSGVVHFASPLWLALTAPVTATVVQGAVMWSWHSPALFDRALDDRGWHVAQHLSFAVSAFLFWWSMLHVRGHRGRLLVSAACLFATSLIGGALGALMALSSSPWYAPYAAMGVSGIGLDPVTDQQLAGLLMWIPGGLVHAGAALFLVHRWLKGRGDDALAAGL